MAFVDALLARRDHAVQLWLNGRLSKAEAIFRDLLVAAPERPSIAGNLGLVLLAQGRYAEAWELFEVRLHGGTAPTDPGLPFPRWSGEPLDGKQVLVWPEEGLGDQIMFARFAEVLQRRGCDVTLVCSPALARLFTASLAVRVLAAQGAIEFPDPDVWLWSSSLLAATQTTLQTLPRAPYLRAEPSGKQPGRIGVVASGNPRHANDAQRSLGEADATRLLALPGAMSLLPQHTGATDLTETAEIIASLDLVISVDTSIAHLAAAMGKPTWILLPAFGTDWRWMRGRQDSPWYPTACLFRQPAPGDWASVLAEVELALATGPKD